VTSLRAGRPRNCSSLLGKDKVFCSSPMRPVVYALVTRFCPTCKEAGT